MAAWFTIYCTKSVANLTAIDVRMGIADADFATLAEDFDIPDDSVRPAVRALCIEPVTEPTGVRFRLSYRPAEFRPVLIHIWDDQERVEEERTEALEILESSTGSGPSEIRKHLESTVAIVALELGWSQLEDMGIVFAGQVAEHIAATFDGLIRDPHDTWWAMKKGRAVQIAGA